MIGITFGTFDLLHPGHVRLLRRAAALCDILVVGVSTDELNFRKKQVYPFYNTETRMEMIEAIKGVSCVFKEESMQMKREYIEKYKADVLIMGDDWKGKFDDLGVETIYLPRTQGISTTDIKIGGVDAQFRS